ncbi:hypothetical protein HO995_00740 [Streptococcus suis]|nr:hypothetical protein [Streptococcus suis]NQP58549.1 hypothetical protein [Streptococcus suis]
MKKIMVFLFFFPFLLLTACYDFTDHSSQGHQETRSVKEGYQELTNQVYLSNNIETSHTEALPTFDTEKGEKEHLVAAAQDFMGEGVAVTEVVEDRSDVTRIQKEDLRADITISRTGSWLYLSSSVSSDLESTFTALLSDTLYNNLDITDFAETLPFSKEDSVGKVQDFLNNLQLGFEDYDYLVYSVSKESLLAYLPTYEKNAADMKGSTVVADNLTDIYYITVYPKLSGKRVIDEETQLGSSGEINFVKGPSLNFIVTEAGIQQILIAGLILPTEKKEEVATVSVQKGLEALKNKYQDLILEDPVYIQDYTIEYVPLPVQEGELYGGNLYRPFLVFKVQESDRSYKVLIDPVTGKEVGST